MTKESFNKINISRKKEGLQLFANTRNAAAGSLRQLNPIITRQRKLSAFFYSIIKSDDTIKYNSQTDIINTLNMLGLPINTHSKNLNNFEDIEQYIIHKNKIRNHLDYDIDGIVIKINKLDHQKHLGNTVKIPKWAIAYKFPPNEMETIIKNIHWSMGRSGIITPVAIMEPILLDGSLVQKASLHNYEFIKTKDIRINDTVKVYKAGDIIPKIDTVILSKRNSESKKYNIPIFCPYCNTKLIHNNNEIALKCPNKFECPEQINESIAFFVSKKAMDIDGLGPKLIKKLIDHNLIKNITDLFKVTYEDLLELDNIKEKSAINIINALNDSKSKSLEYVIFGLGIPNVGFQAAEIISKEFKSINNIINIKTNELQKIDGIGPIIAKNIEYYFSSDFGKKIIDELKNRNVNLIYIEKSSKTILNNKNIVITGKFTKKRQEIIKILKYNGAKIQSNVTKSTDILIVGENPGSKIQKANNLNIITWNEETLNNNINI